MAYSFQQSTQVRNLNKGNLGRDPRLVNMIHNANNKCDTWGKAWEVGDQATVFYPFLYDATGDLLGKPGFYLNMGVFMGHKVSDMKLFNTSFIPDLTPIGENGRVDGPGTLIYQFSRIAPLLVTAEKEKKLADLSAKDWSVLGQTAYMQARKQVEDEYDTKNNMKAKRAVVGKLDQRIITEVVFITMDSTNSSPVFEGRTKTKRYIQDLSYSRYTKLITLCNDPIYGILAQNPGLVPEEGKVYFLEVLYNFTSAQNNRMEAGRAEPQGVAQAVTLAARFPDSVAKIDELKQDFPKNGDEIALHAWGLDPVRDEQLLPILKRIMFDAAANLGSLSDDDKKRLIQHANVIDYLRVAPEDKALTAEIEKQLGHAIGAQVSSESSEDAAPTMSSIMSGTEEDATPDFSKQNTESALSQFMSGASSAFPPDEDEGALAAAEEGQPNLGGFDNMNIGGSF